VVLSPFHDPARAQSAVSQFANKARRQHFVAGRRNRRQSACIVLKLKRNNNSQKGGRGKSVGGEGCNGYVGPDNEESGERNIVNGGGEKQEGGFHQG